jgi:hypothetical protein
LNKKWGISVSVKTIVLSNLLSLKEAKSQSRLIQTEAAK